MDLGGYTSLVCKKVGTTDSDSKAVCAGFVQNRYQWIYYRFDWRDGRRRDSAIAVGGTDNLALPPGIDRIISIRCGDHFLDPVDDTFFVETDPTIFERTGITQYYQEYTDQDDNSKRIRLYPIPAIDASMLIIGKKALPPLMVDSDSPIIRGIDQVLLAYAEADMLEYHRQYGKAQTKFAEAEKLFADAVALEQQQTNVPRKVKNLSVGGDSLAEMTDAVCARIGQWTPDVGIMVREFIRRSYVQVYDAYLWPESLVMARVPSEGSQVVLPWYFASVVSIRADSKNWSLGPMELSSYFAVTPEIFEQNTGPSVAYSTLSPVAVGVLPPIRERLALVSGDMHDNTPVMIRGETGGDIVTESLTLNGNSPVYTGYTYDVPLTIAKQITVGEVSIRGASSNVLLAIIRANERERKRIRIWLQPASSSTQRCIVLGKKAIIPLIQDEDTPGIRNIANYLIHSAVSEAYSKQGDQNGAAACKVKADASLQALLDLHVRQTTTGPRVFPYVQPWDSLGCDYDSWLMDKGNFV